MAGFFRVFLNYQEVENIVKLSGQSQLITRWTSEITEAELQDKISSHVSAGTKWSWELNLRLAI
jgi:hypothetical protein